MNAAAIAHALRQVVDPELGLDVVTLGLVYDIEVRPDCVRVVMTMTSPACPMGAAMLEAAERVAARAAAAELPGARVDVVAVFDPPWDVEMVADEGRPWLGLPAREPRSAPGVPGGHG